MFFVIRSAGLVSLLRWFCRTKALTALTVLALTLFASGIRAAAPPALVFRISTENSASHFQTKVVQRFVTELQRRTQGRLSIDYRHSAQLFRDQDVIRALNDGKVDMAVPGNWQFDRYDPAASTLMLPMFLGRDAADHHRIRDGLVGQLISAQLEQSLDVVIPGRWIDLGFANVYTVQKTVSGYPDMAGLRIRIAGGEAVAAQLSAVGALPSVVAWPDLPNVLQQGRLDGLLTTHETIASAQLWAHGLRHATENKAYFAQYIPIIARSYWNALPDDLRQAIRASWDSVVDGARAEAAQAQREARRQLEAHGVKVVELPAAALAAWRHQVAANQSALAQKLGIPMPLMQATQKQFPLEP